MGDPGSVATSDDKSVTAAQPSPSTHDESPVMNRAADPESSEYFRRDPRFWLIMLTLCFSVTLGSLESTVVITSLPTIVEKLGLGKNYVWVANVYFLAK
jgi:hypothetical protein